MPGGLTGTGRDGVGRQSRRGRRSYKGCFPTCGGGLLAAMELVANRAGDGAPTRDVSPPVGAVFWPRWSWSIIAPGTALLQGVFPPL